MHMHVHMHTHAHVHVRLRTCACAHVCACVRSRYMQVRCFTRSYYLVETEIVGFACKTHNLSLYQVVMILKSNPKEGVRPKA